MHPLSLSIAALAGRRHLPLLRRQLPRAHALLRPALRELSVAIVGDRRMAALHGRFMGLATPTDVLTFELEHDFRGRVLAGEVVICAGEARRRAGPDPRAVGRELLLYALHGMLHLCGYDDRNAADFQTMHAREDDILRRLGIGPVFQSAETRR